MDYKGLLRVQDAQNGKGLLMIENDIRSILSDYGLQPSNITPCRITFGDTYDTQYSVEFFDVYGKYRFDSVQSRGSFSANSEDNVVYYSTIGMCCQAVDAFNQIQSMIDSNPEIKMSYLYDED